MKKQYEVQLEVLPHNPGIVDTITILATAKSEDHAVILARQFCRRCRIPTGILKGIFLPDFTKEYKNRIGSW